MTRQYNKAALGGTFDHLHKGHKTLIDTALQLANQVVIGVLVRPHPNQKQYYESIQSFEQRKKSVIQYLESLSACNRVELVDLEDAYGPTITDSAIDCLVVSEMTYDTAKAVNQMRINSHMPPLTIEVIKTEIDQQGKDISSTRIRAGKIDRYGNVYQRVYKHGFNLNPLLRNKLKEPYGQLYVSVSQLPINIDKPGLYVVGDKVVRECKTHKLDVSYAVIDGRIEREVVGVPQDYYGFANVHFAHNPPGSISRKAAGMIADTIGTPSTLVVISGEEDLLVLPTVLMAPLKSTVLYGQPHQGVVLIRVTEAIKKDLLTIMRTVFLKRIIKSNKE